MKFIKKLIDAVAPPENRLVAAVAFVRTFGQSIRGTGIVGALIGAGITVTDLVSIDWAGLGLGVLAIILTALITALDAYFNVLSNGLSPKYTEAVVTSLPKQIEQTQAVKDAVTEAVQAA